MRTMRLPRAFIDGLDFRRSLAIIVVVLGGFAACLMHVRHAAGAGHDDAVAQAALRLAPLVAFLLSPALIGLCFGFVAWVDERTWTPWQGRYHAFDDHQVRLVETRGDLWFCSADVHAALALRRRPAVMADLRPSECGNDPRLGEILSLAGLVRLLGRSTDRTRLRFLRWAERDVRKPWCHRRDRLDTARESTSLP